MGARMTLEEAENYVAAIKETLLTLLGLAAIGAWVWLEIRYGPDLLWGTVGPLFFGVLGGLLARRKHRNVAAWTAASMYFLFFAPLVLLVLPKKHEATCPWCLEGIQLGALVCPHCQREILPTSG